MKVYLLSRKGVFCQGHAGIFSGIAEARKAAEAVLAREPDNYHEFVLEEFTLNEQVGAIKYAHEIGLSPDYTPTIIEIYKKGT